MTIVPTTAPARLVIPPMIEHHDHEEGDVEEEGVGVERADEHAEERAGAPDEERGDARTRSPRSRADADPDRARGRVLVVARGAQAQARCPNAETPTRPSSRRAPSQARAAIVVVVGMPATPAVPCVTCCQFLATTLTMISTANVASPAVSPDRRDERDGREPARRGSDAPAAIVAGNGVEADVREEDRAGREG